MLQIIRVPLSKKLLRTMPKEDRALVFLLGYAANQVTMVSKLMIFATNRTPPDAVEQLVTGAQTQMLARMTIGVLSETWEMVRTRFLSQPISKDHVTRLSPSGQMVFEELKKHFGSSGLLSRLRNGFAYHYPSTDDLEAGFEAASADAAFDDSWNWYLENTNYNSFYFASDIVVLHGMLIASGETSLVKAQEKIMGEVKIVSRLMPQFFGELLRSVLGKYFGAELIGQICTEIKDAPGALDVWIPFYVEIPSEEQLARSG
jgi:hypothetical protein